MSQFPWVKILKGNNGELHHVKCFVCLVVWWKDFLLAPKLNDNLEKHVRKTKDLNKYMSLLGVKVGKWYINKWYHHLQNEPIFYHKNHFACLVVGMVGYWHHSGTFFCSGCDCKCYILLHMLGLVNMDSFQIIDLNVYIL